MTAGRFWLFGGDVYYAGGGLNDFVGSFDTVIQAEEQQRESDLEWWHVLDIAEGIVVSASRPQAFGSSDFTCPHRITEKTNES